MPAGVSWTQYRPCHVTEEEKETNGTSVSDASKHELMQANG